MKIGIAGAGIGGLSAAAMLARNGHRVHVFDQFDRPKPVGSGLVIQPVGQDVLRHIQPALKIDRIGRKITRMQGHDARSGRKVLDVAYTGSGRARYGMAIHRSVLFDTVLDASITAGAHLITSSEVIDIGPDNRRFIFADGNPSDRFDLLVDATGAHSPLSPLLGQTLPFGALWGTVDWPTDCTLPDDQLSQVYQRANHMVGVLPIGTVPGHSRPQATFFWSLPSDAYQNWRDQRLGNWRAEVTSLWPEVAPFVDQITNHSQMTMARYTHATNKRPWREGVVHIGDAAHRASPQLGQGANMALLDAYALSAATGMTTGREVLATYARLRRWHVRFYQMVSYAFTPMYQSNSRILPVFRDRIMAPVLPIWPVAWGLSRLVCGDLIRPYAGLSDPPRLTPDPRTT